MNAEDIINNYRELVLIALNVDNIINAYYTCGSAVVKRNYIHKYDDYSQELEYNIKFNNGNVELYHMGVHWEELEVDCFSTFPVSFLSWTKEELEVVALDRKEVMEIKLEIFLKEKAEEKAAKKLRRETILGAVKNNIKEINVKFKEWKGESPKYARKKLVIHDNRIFLEEEDKELECVFIYSRPKGSFESYRTFAKHLNEPLRLCSKKLVTPIANIIREVLEEDYVI